MKQAKLMMLLVALVAVAISGLACGAEETGQSKAKAAAPPQEAPQTATKTIVYYFHGTGRCQTCQTIQAYAEEAVRAAFGAELSIGQLLWLPLNVDEAGNEHFVKDYQLYTRSLVVVDGSNRKRFKNLEKVWQLVGDKPAFVKYVQDEVRAFRKS
jgi:hypothetical protein